MPSLVFANKDGEMLDYDGLEMAGRLGFEFFSPQLEDLIPLPEGSELFVLPDRLPVGMERDSGEPALLDTNPFQPGQPIQAVAAFMAPAHTANHIAAFQAEGAAPQQLPLFAYTAVGWHDGQFWVSAFRSDRDTRQDIAGFDLDAIERNTKKRLQRYSHNRLIQHLGKCCLTYGCPAAKNYFLDRWEAPLPSSPTCNAGCLGCISLQPSGCCPSTQQRLSFVPTPKEIAEVAVEHLQQAPLPIVSFGQGCEGEPLLQADTMAEAITLIRSQTDKGTINLNSNASLPHAVEKLAQAGLDSIRVSLNSAREEVYTRYYRPKGYAFTDVLQSIRIMKERGRHVSLNYFILPGVTDDPAEFAALLELLRPHTPDLIQLRNLNMDPDIYLDAIGHQPDSEPMGMQHCLNQIKKHFPALKFGYFNPFLG